MTRTLSDLEAGLLCALALAVLLAGASVAYRFYRAREVVVVESAPQIQTPGVIRPWASSWRLPPGEGASNVFFGNGASNEAIGNEDP